MLGRRELSEKQLRDRLSKRGHSSASIDDAIARLSAERYLDDARVAAAIARNEVTVRGRGRIRVLRRIQAAGIASELAERATTEVLQDVDADALLSRALERRLRGGRSIADEKEFSRLYRYLLGQGFESDRVLGVLRARRKS